MTSVKARFGIEVESGLSGVYDADVEEVLKSESIEILRVYYDCSVLGEYDIFPQLRDLYGIDEYSRYETDEGLEIVLKSSVSLKRIEENLKKLSCFIDKIGLNCDKVFSTDLGCSGHVHVSSKDILYVYSNYREYVNKNEISLKLLALYTVYSFCSSETFRRNDEYRRMGLHTKPVDTKYQFIRVVKPSAKREHIEIRVMDSLYDINKYVDYLKLIRVFIRNTIDVDFNKTMLDNMLDNTEFIDAYELNDFIVYAYNYLISNSRESMRLKTHDTIRKILSVFVDSLDFKYNSFKKRIESYINE